jgi:anhydro-N-acetylmuramic acid kinase
MSGTSLDGLDMALCEFAKDDKGYTYNILAAQTIAYPEEWKARLQSAANASAQDYLKLHALYGKYIGDQVLAFIKAKNRHPQLVASHGHTVFHQPQNGFSAQLGCGNTIAAVTGINTAFDFRSLDVALGGQGAPLVPIGDELLFGEYEACLNIGGIANVSLRHNGKRIAYDVCVANMLLNNLASRVNQPYDRDGEIARSGKIDKKILEELNALDYYAQEGAKSLGREWFESNMHIILGSTLPVPDLLATATEHVGQTIARDLESFGVRNVLASGGGAWNKFLIERIRHHGSFDVVIPDPGIVNFKEALIFAFLGYLRITDQVNTLASVTGARMDSSGGSVVLVKGSE